MRVLEISEGVEHFEFVQVNWSIPFNQALSNPDVTCGVSRNNPDEKDAFARPDPRPPILEIVPTRRTADGRPVPTGEEGDAPALAKAGEILPYVLTVPLSFFFTGAFQWIEHPVVPFRVRQRRTDQTQSALPIAPPPPKGIVYTVTPRIEAMARIDGPATRASGANLTWYHHTGRDDGSFNWEGPKIVGTGWGHLKQVFSGGDGIIYAVTPVVEATLPSGIGPGMGGHPASGGELWWYRHSGRDDGSFRWDGPKKVGTGWGRFTHVFSGGNGVIYAIDPVVEASVHVTGGTTPASGGDLWWYRHVGRADGSFQWEGPKKVGTGWGQLKQVFSGGDGIIYAVTPVVEASLPSGIGPGMGGHPASGGDLMWARHLGREDGSFNWDGPMKKVGTGWGELKHVFSDGDGIIYAVTPVVEASLPSGIGPGMDGHPASGGGLMWARHLGREDGSFRWEGPMKKVGTGWGDLQQIFSG